MTTALKKTIETAWEQRQAILADTKSARAREVLEAVCAALSLLDSGEMRVAEPDGAGNWIIHSWLKQAVVLSFGLMHVRTIRGGPGNSQWSDRIGSKFDGWSEDDFRKAGFRAVPGAIVRHSAWIGPGAVLMPCFVNVAARVGEGTMIDTWATVGSCAQVGKNCHISGGTGIGGVLEPLQAAPVIIEDNVFIGARSEIAEGTRVGEGAVISMGVFLGASTKIIDRETGQIFRGVVPPFSVVVPGSLPGKPLPDGSPGPSLACAIIVKTVDAQTRRKTGINELLRYGP
ncbi:MAG: 2,3,4,5-tetrahydropyridine-2,6-dicarboxylate N-succinyltransferase [Pseudomonadota bacterium]|nr:2,3,4,5-tetrahydropyridine-2,6-dicarboxylate N-succinyltransferase [Pseudomonadota bacterium]